MNFGFLDNPKSLQMAFKNKLNSGNNAASRWTEKIVCQEKYKANLCTVITCELQLDMAMSIRNVPIFSTLRFFSSPRYSVYKQNIVITKPHIDLDRSRNE